MNQSAIPIKQKNRKTASYYVWVGVFFLFLAGIISGLYYSTIKIDYVWRWYRIPQYFAFKEKTDTKAQTDGRITDISRKDGMAVVTVRTGRDEKSYNIPESDLKVSVGDYLYPGYVMATRENWKPGILVQGLWLTLEVSVISTLLGIVIGLFGGLARLSSNPAFKWSSITYIEIIRGSPLLVQIFIWYFVLGTLINTILAKYGISPIPPLWYGVAALACFTGAYVAEIVRAGIQSIHRGQIEASRSLGMTYAQSMRYVILPQALRRILPPLAGQFISLIKDSSLLGIIAVRELSKATREVVTTSLQPFELWFVCALLYLFLTFTLSMFVQYLERRTAV
jgi:polar amino acid transport system permease protein